MPRQRNHSVRQYFQYTDIENRNVCNICNRHVKGNHAGNLLKHLQIYHHLENMPSLKRKYENNAQCEDSAKTNQKETKLKIKMPRKQNHYVRQYFQFIDTENTNICNICNRSVKGNHAGNLLKHLQIYHHIEHKKVTNLRKKYENNVDCENLAKIDQNEAKLQLDNFLRQNSNNVQIKINREIIKIACLEIVTVNGRPFSALEDSGFRKILDPVLAAINSTSVSRNLSIGRKNIKWLINNEANKLKNKIRNEVKDKLLNIKLDYATRMNRSILGINIQFIQDGELMVQTLAMLELTEKLTAEYLRCKVIDVLKDYEINLKYIYSVILDNGENILDNTVLATENDTFCDNDEELNNNVIDGIVDETIQNINSYLSKECEGKICSIYCAAHTLQLAVNDSLKSQEECISALRALVKKLRNPTMVNLLKQDNILIPPIDHATRWSSTYNMIEHLLHYKSSFIELAATNKDLHLDSTHWDRASEIMEALTPAAWATKKIQSQQLTPTDFYAEWLKCKLATSKLNSLFAKNVMQNLIIREKKLLDSVELNAAIFLDPRFQATLSEDHRLDAKNHLKKIWNTVKNLHDYEEKKNETQIVHIKIEQPSTSDEDEFSKLISEMSSQHAVDNNSAVKEINISAILENFDNIPRIDHDSSILEYWEINKYDKPELFELSQIIFSVPVTQVSLERAFSSLKYIVASLSEHLTPKSLENIILVRLNKKFN